MPVPQPAVTAERNTLSTSLWKGLLWGTSEKSESHPSASMPVTTAGTPPGFVTITSCRVPAGREGVLAVMCVASTYTMDVKDAPPSLTAAPGRKLVPVIVTGVPAADGPE